MNLRNAALLGFAVTGLVAGAALGWAGFERAAPLVLAAAVLPVLATLLVEIAESLRRGEVGLDIVAALSMSAALAVGEALAAAVVAVMYAGGTVLEDFAEGRARREMHDLLARVPRSATRHRNGALEEVALDDIRPGDRLLIRRGEIAPVDGTLESASALLDQSALTGEALPVRIAAGAEVMSGSGNSGEAFDLLATRTAGESTYAGIVRLVAQAERSKAPMSRLADRYSLVFLALTVVIASAAGWASGDPVRAVAVLVVATPCPLILAVPVALVAGLSRAARLGVLVKGARPLEAMAKVRTIVLDKTGTLTEGRPRIVAIDTLGTAEEADAALALAATLEQASKHPMAHAIVAAARERGLALGVPSDVVEVPGEGLSGTVDGRRVAVGGPGFVARHLGTERDAGGTRGDGAALAVVAVDGAPAARIVLADPPRAGADRLVDGLRRLGVRRIVLATGDRRVVAEAAVRGLGLDAVHADLAPREKVDLVRAERAGGPVMMVGDGVNDAPALAAADVGVAMGARGAAASAEAADVVLLVDRLDRLLPGLEIAQGARTIALQSVVVGIGLSVLGMIAAALGWLTPVEGALAQEAIDVAVILNALRALSLRPTTGPAAGSEAAPSPASGAEAPGAPAGERS